MKKDQIKLLLIEDNEADSRLISEYLKESPVSSFGIRSTKSLSEALTAIQEEKFDVVLTDLNLPDSAGLVTLNAIIKAGRDLTVLVLTGFDDEKSGIEALHQGAQDYLVKGKIDSGLLAKSVRYAIERKKLESLLREKSAEQQIILNSVPAMIFYKDTKNCFVRTNKAFEDLMGLPKEKLEGRCLPDLFPREQAEVLFKDDLEVINSGKPKLGVIEPMDTPKGQKLLQTDRIPYFDEQGKVTGVIGFSLDVTERERVEEALRDSENKLKRAQQIAQLGNWELDLADNILSWSDEVYRIFGLKPQEFKATYEAFLEAVHPDDRAAVDEAYSGSLREGRSTYQIEHRIVRRSDGRVRFVHEKCEHIKDASGKVIRSSGMVQDITERKEVENELKKARQDLENKVHQRTAQLVATNEELIKEITERQKIEHELRAKNVLFKLATKTDSRVEYINGVAKLLRGWSGCKYVGIRFVNEQGAVPYESYLGFSRQFYKSESAISLQKDQCACIRVITGKPEPSDLKAMTQFGSFYCGDTEKYMAGLSASQKAKFRGVCVEAGFSTLTIIPLSYKGKIIGAIHLADKNKNKLSQERVRFLEELVPQIGEDYYKLTLADQVRISQELLERIFSSTNLMIAYFDSGLRFIRVNKAYAQMEGKPPEFFAGKKHFDLYPDKENEAIFKQVLETGEPYSAYAKPFVYLQHPERGITYWDWSLQPVKDAKGKVEGLLFVIVDVTKRKRAEEELVKTQLKLLDTKRLTDIGTLAATVAHELRNPLAAIQMASYNIRRKAQNPLLDKHLSTIDNKVDESEQIISNLLFYSRIRPPRYENVSVCKLINECAEFAKKRFAKEGISLSVDCAPIKNLSIEADPLQIKEVFGNILNNAFESKPYGGQSVIEVKAEANNGQVKIMIKDNGDGIGQQDLERIFDPFFTTKAKGTGLGLTVCKQIVEFHGGAIDIKSKKSSGTTVIVKLPIKREANE
jgi:PAS domain S-box-containing protein